MYLQVMNEFRCKAKTFKTQVPASWNISLHTHYMNNDVLRVNPTYVVINSHAWKLQGARCSNK